MLTIINTTNSEFTDNTNFNYNRTFHLILLLGTSNIFFNSDIKLQDYGHFDIVVADC